MDHHLNFPAQRSSPIHTTAYLISHFGLFKNHLQYNFSLWNASASRLVLLITLVAPLLLGLRQKSSTGLRRMHRAPSLPSPASVHSLFSYPSRSPATWASINSWNKSFSLLPQRILSPTSGRMRILPGILIPHILPAEPPVFQEK